MPEATLDDVRRRFLVSLSELESAGPFGRWHRERSRAKQVNRVLIHQWFDVSFAFVEGDFRRLHQVT